MKLRKKITILGPISNTGGRAVEAREIYNSLSPFYNVSILSTEPFSSDITSNSPLFGTKYRSIDNILYNSHKDIRIISTISWLKNSFQGQPELYINSKANKKIANLINRKKSVLSDSIEKSDLIFLLMQIESEYLKDIIEYSISNNIPIIFRPTGEITGIPGHLVHLLPHIDKIICHSSKNFLLLKAFSKKFSIIDQNAFEEEKLIQLPLVINKPLTFGFLGRFSTEKGGIELANFFSKRSEKFIFGGDGPDKKKILQIIENSNNCQYIGKILPDQVDEFMKKIDVLIIGSKYTETGPYTGIEAMAAGKIIFSTKVGAMEDRLESTANNFWFDIDNPDTLLELVERVNKLTDKELLHICTKNRIKYCNNYGRSKISNSYLKACKLLLK